MAPDLLKLLADNRRAPRRFEIVASAADDEATIYLYDAIVGDQFEAELFGGVAAAPFVKELAKVQAKTINLRINSPGGDVFAARAIEQALREHPAHVVAHVDGVAASAATVIAMAADEIRIAPGALFMVHNSFARAVGNSDELMEVAALLEKIDGTIVATYAARTGKDEQAIRELMAAETWFTGAEAVEAGFADGLAADAPAINAAWNLSAYAKAPKTQEAAPAPAVAEPEAPAPVAEAPRPATVDKTDELRRALRLRVRTA